MGDVMKGGFVFAGMFLIGAYSNWGHDGAMSCVVLGLLTAGFSIGFGLARGKEE